MTKAITTWLAVMAIAAICLTLMITTARIPYRMQLTVAVGYTLGVVLHVFFATRIGTGFDTQNQRVRRQLPKLLLIHSAFLTVVLSALTLSAHFEPSYPYWLTSVDPKGRSFLVLSEILMGTCIATSQVLWSRMILARAIGHENWSFWEGFWRKTKPGSARRQRRPTSRNKKGKAHQL